VDNDCDGSVDEPFSAKGTNATHFVRPAVVQVNTNVWMYQYEASRPSATGANPGSRSPAGPGGRHAGQDARVLGAEQDPLVQRDAGRSGTNLPGHGR
jgi:hypothetical protein